MILYGYDMNTLNGIISYNNQPLMLLTVVIHLWLNLFSGKRAKLFSRLFDKIEKIFKKLKDQPVSTLSKFFNYNYMINEGICI